LEEKEWGRGRKSTPTGRVENGGIEGKWSNKGKSVI
jgi:hypothetical protein